MNPRKNESSYTILMRCPWCNADAKHPIMEDVKLDNLYLTAYIVRCKVCSYEWKEYL